MPVVPTQELLADAFAQRYGVAAINVVNDLTMEAVLAAADEARAPVIVQTSVKTVRSIGSDVLFAMWQAMAARVRVPVSLHLDHCPDRELIRECLARGWSSVLFDGSALSFDENLRQTQEVVVEAHRLGAAVEGELEPIRGVEDDLGSDAAAVVQPLEDAIRFMRDTGIDCFAPAIGNAHGVYHTTPELDGQRVSDLVAATPVPIALHGGSGLSPDQFADLIRRGCAKVNISTALKVAYMRANLSYLEANPTRYDPPSLFVAVRAAVMGMVQEHLQLLDSVGRAA